MRPRSPDRLTLEELWVHGASQAAINYTNIVQKYIFARYSCILIF